MAVYLEALAQGRPPGAATSSIPSPEGSLILALGKSVYDDQCAVCHGSEGRGKPPDFPPLADNHSIQMQSAVNPIRMVLNGGYPPGTSANPMPYGMPPFAQSLSDDEVAAVVTYIRTAWGNRGAPVSAREANILRSAPLN
jgi:mono/diheme cytochrome c family protein